MAHSKERKNSWGGKRAGAGRPASSPFVAHVARESFEGKRAPLLITLRLRSGFPSLRSKLFMKVFERASLRARRFGLRITHFNVLPKSILLICEFHEREQLERSFKSLNTTLAIALKRAYAEHSGRHHTGPVFLGRFMMKLLDSGARLKAAMKNVLAGAFTAQAPNFSSASLFTMWKKLFEPSERGSIQPTAPPEARARAVAITALPQFWLSRAGWMRT
jgi:hypothetical protein